MEGDAFFQLEGPGGEIFVGFPGLGQVGLWIEIFIRIEQWLPDMQ